MSVVQRPNAAANWYLPGIFGGMWITLKALFKNLFNREQMQTLDYPEEKYEYSPRFKGTHVLTVKQDGSIRCTACMLCATNCPAQCITIIASEHQDKSVEKFPIAYEIDMLRCVFCGFCEEACPVDAIRMGPEWQVPGVSGTNFVKGIDYLAHRPALKGGIQSVLDDKERHDKGI
jgi:NADH-quinone oxidoreductase subunit I